MFSTTAFVSSALLTIKAEIAIAEASHKAFEEKIAPLPPEKQAELRALRQIALESKPERPPAPQPQSSGAGPFLLGFLFGELL